MEFDGPADWQTVSLAELGEVNRGRSRHRPRHADHLYGGPYPFIQTGDIKSSGGRVSSFSQTYSEAGLAQSRLWPAGTMCITIAANIAETAVLDFPACFPDSVVGFIAEASKANVRFVEYMFRMMRGTIQHQATGSVQDNINLETLSRLRFPLPPLAEQNRIAHILGALDDKIELNQRMNATLEGISRAIFKSWFVDFDPVRQKAAGKQPVGMDAKTAALFPDSFEDSEIGEVPKGWRIAEVSDFLWLSRQAIDPSEHPTETFDHYSIPAFDSGSWPSSDTGADIKSQKLLVAPGSVLISKLNPRTPRVWIPQERRQQRSVASTEFLVTVPKEATGIGVPFIFCFASSESVIEYLASHASGTSNSHQRVRPDDFLSLRVALAPNTVLRAFDGIVRTLLQRSNHSRRGARTLAALRDSLLPKLLSGEVRIPEIEATIASATR